jgi:Cu-Zn family superoxide dismutase
MHVVDGLKMFCVGVLLCAGCKEEDGGSDLPVDSGRGAAVDSGGAPSDAGSGTDSGASTDSGATKDSGAAVDSGATKDSGAGLDAGPGDAGNDAAENHTIATSTGSWTVFPNPYGDGGANPAMGIQGSAQAVHAGSAGMKVTLNVSGLPGARGFGSHLHKLTCDMMTAGGHFQHMPAPPDASVNDPAYGNPSNEVWLDFTTDDAGVGMGTAMVDWIPTDGGANAIVVHDHTTGDGGLAGPKLACLPIPF